MILRLASLVAVLSGVTAAIAPSGSHGAALSTRSDFDRVLESLAAAWSERDTAAALVCFTDDAIYMQPPDQQLYQGAAELRLLFDGLKPGTVMQFHGAAFDPESQAGFAEFSFGRHGSATAVHGVVRVTLSGGRISSWREYFESGPASFEEFVAVDGKTWKWTAASLE